MVSEGSGDLGKGSAKGRSSSHCSGCFNVFRVFLHIAVTWCFGILYLVAKHTAIVAGILHRTRVGEDARARNIVFWG